VRRWLLGGKGANLAEMAALGLNIPPGFTLTTEVCSQYCASGSAGAASSLSPAIWDETLKGLNFVEEAMGKRLIHFFFKKSAARISQSFFLCL
jgi:pyruvate,orthophosphate dikinase